MGDSLRLGLRTRVLDAESMGEMGDRNCSIPNLTIFQVIIPNIGKISQIDRR